MTIVVPYHQARLARYVEERRRLADAFAGLAVTFEHVGSTAVPGLDAKPTIDIAVAVEDLRLPVAVIAALQALGYEDRGEMGVPSRRYFRKGATYPRDFNLQVVVRGSVLWHEMLHFRDLLRRHPPLASSYAAIKRDAAEGVKADSAGPTYKERKARFIESTLAAAANDDEAQD